VTIHRGAVPIDLSARPPKAPTAGQGLAQGAGDKLSVHEADAISPDNATDPSRSRIIDMTDTFAIVRADPPRAAASALLVLGLATIAGFFFFQYVLGYPPCPLCLEQRIPYYFGVPLAALLWLGAHYGASRKVLVLGFAAIAAVMLWNAGLAAYHAGVEWKFWPGPTDCSGPINPLGGTNDLMKSLQSIRVVRCDEAAWRLFGISLSGYNVLVSLAMAVFAAWGAKAAYARAEYDEK
jgi:disulfide bond formation protein DsbB